MAMKNISHSPVTEMLSGRHKIWLIIGLALLPIADLSACIVLWVFGAASSYWILPFLMTVADLLYLLAVVLSNLRFKYAKTLFIFYILFTVISIIVWLAKFASNPITLANIALSAWALLHVFGIVAVAISFLYATRRFRSGRHVQLVLAIIFSAAVLLCAVFYGVTVIGDGYFGQGHGNLPLVYNYIFGDECEVTDVVYGNGDSVVIPYEFNGRKVTRVSSKIFTYANIKSVTLNCDPAVELCEDIETSEINTNIKIYANKKDVDTIKQKLYHSGGSAGFYQYLHELGNNVQPIGLDKDEVYITFDYDRNSHYYAKQNIIPTWYGKKGDTFRLSDIEGVDYVSYSDINSDDDLYYCYSNYDKQIMSPLTYDGSVLDGMTIDKSRNNVPVRFQKIYKVFAGASNDDKYPTSAFFKYTMVDGMMYDYALTVSDNADELLTMFNRGEAFTRTMQYKESSNGAYKPFTSLSELLGEGYNNVTITPYWELVKPQVTLSTVTDEADIIYGDDFELTASVTHPLNGGFILSYEWYDDVQRIGYDRVLQTTAQTVGMHTYTAIVKLSAPDATSLTTANAAEINVKVNKRPLTITWEHTSGGLMGEETQVYGTESVFDGTERHIQPKAQNVVGNDFMMFMGYSVMHAGTHTERVTLNSTFSEKYYIAEGETYTYTIKPCPVPLTWDDQTEFEYNGELQGPMAHAFDLSGDELVVYYDGLKADAGENYTAIAKLANSDYTVDDASEKSKGYKITPTQVDVTWGNPALVYNKSVQVPEASATGVNGSDVKLSVIGGQVHANIVDGVKVNTYTALAHSDDGNYTFNPDTRSQEFTISPYTIDKITWTNTTVTYNGKLQSPQATATDADGQTMIIAVSAEINADEYTKQAMVSDDYVIADGGTTTFIILPMEVRVEWSNTSFVYDGTVQKPTATAKGVDGVALPLTVTGAVKTGAGVAKAEFAAEQKNYTLTNASKVFTIERKTLTVTVHDATYVYGQSVEIDIDVQGIVSGDDVTAIPTAKYTPDEDGNVPVGEYDIIIQLDGADKDCYEIVVVRQGKVTVTAPTSTED